MIYATLRFFFAGILIMSPLIHSAYAQEAEAEYEIDQEKVEDMQDVAEDAREAREEAYAVYGELMDTLKHNQKRHLRMLTANHNLIQTVKLVQGDVQDAIKQCGESNPDMKTKLDDRYQEWDDVVSPLLAEADGNLENMIIAQDYTSERKVRSVLKVMDRSRDRANKKIEKIPVTTPEACEYLYEKMQETQGNMKGLLRKTLVSFPKAYNESGWEQEDAVEESTEDSTQDTPPAE